MKYLDKSCISWLDITRRQAMWQQAMWRAAHHLSICMRQTRPSLASLTKSSLTTGATSAPVSISAISKLGPEELPALAEDTARSRPESSSVGAGEEGSAGADGARGAAAGASVGERAGESTGVDTEA